MTVNDQRHSFPFLLLITLLLPMLAGCVSEEAPVPDGIHGFRAVYQTNHGERFFSLDGPFPIVDRDWKPRVAYRITFSSLPYQVERPGWISWWVDGSFHLLREDQPTYYGPEEDTYLHYAVSWTGQGLLAPLGIGLPYLARSGFTEVVYGDQMVQIDLDSKGGSFTLDLPLDVGDSHINPYIPMKGWMRFSDGKLFPDAFDLTANKGPRGTLREFELLDVLEPIESDSWDPKQPVQRPRQGPLFNGETKDDLGVGFTYLEALEGLLEQSAQARGLLDAGGCVVWFQMEMPPVEKDDMYATILGETEASFIVDIVDQAGAGWEWAYDRARSPLGVRYSIRSQDEIQQPRGCAEADRSPWPKLSTTEFVRRALEVPISMNGSFSFMYDRGSLPLSTSSRPEAGWDSYALFGRPDWVELPSVGTGVVGYEPYILGVHAETGWLDTAILHPSDVLAWDGRK